MIAHKYIRLRSRVNPERPPLGFVDLFHDIASGSMKFRKANGADVSLGGEGFSFAPGAAVPDATGGAVIDAEARTALNAVISRLEALGLIATI